MAAQAISFIAQSAVHGSSVPPRYIALIDYPVRMGGVQLNLHNSAVIGEVAGETQATPLERVLAMVDVAHRRPTEQWWLSLSETFRMLAVPDIS